MAEPPDGRGGLTECLAHALRAWCWEGNYRPMLAVLDFHERLKGRSDFAGNTRDLVCALATAQVPGGDFEATVANAEDLKSEAHELRELAHELNAPTDALTFQRRFAAVRQLELRLRLSIAHVERGGRILHGARGGARCGRVEG